MRSIIERAQGWSRIAGVILLILMILSTGAASQECEIPEEPAKPKPFLEAVRIAFEEKGYEYDGMITDEWERWKNPDGSLIELVDAENYKTARLTFRLSKGSISTNQRGEMKDFIAIALPAWTDGKDWVGKNIPIALNSEMRGAGGTIGYAQDKSFAEKYHEEIVGDNKEIHISLVKSTIYVRPVGLTLTVAKYD